MTAPAEPRPAQMTPDTPLAPADELWQWANTIEQRMRLCLSEAVFPDTDPAARQARNLLRQVITDLRQRSIDLTDDKDTDHENE